MPNAIYKPSAEARSFFSLAKREYPLDEEQGLNPFFNQLVGEDIAQKYIMSSTVNKLTFIENPDEENRDNYRFHSMGTVDIL